MFLISPLSKQSCPNSAACWSPKIPVIGTSLPKDLRCYIKYNNESLIAYDIKNSQPLFLTKLIQDSNTKWVDESEFELFKSLTINGNFRPKIYTICLLWEKIHIYSNPP